MMDNYSVEYSEDEAYEQAVKDRRLTRVLSENNPSDDEDKDDSSDNGSDISSNEETSNEEIHSPGFEHSEGMIDQVKGMSAEQVEELIHKLNITDEDKNIVQEDFKEQTKHQKTKTQNTRPTKHPKGFTKSDKGEDECTSSPENNTNNPKLEVKGKRNNPKSTTMKAKSDENLSKLGNKTKVNQPTLDNNKSEEISNKKTKGKAINDVNEKKASKFKTDTVVIEDTPKENQIKSSKNVDSGKKEKELGSDNLESMENHEGMRVMRPRKVKQVLKEANIDVKMSNETTLKGPNKKNKKNIELEAKNTEGNAEPSNLNEELTDGQKKKFVKKGVSEKKKLEENSASSDPTVKERAAVKIKRTAKEVSPEIEQHVETLSIVKENVRTNRSRKNDKADVSESVQNLTQPKMNSNVKNTKSKKTAKSIETETINDVPPEPDSTKVTKPKSKSVKNKKQVANEENKVNDDAVPIKRTTRKK